MLSIRLIVFKRNEISGKTNIASDFINQRENEQNPMLQVNSNYVYERVKRNQQLNQDMIDKNREQFVGINRPDVDDYYNKPILNIFFR